MYCQAINESDFLGNIVTPNTKLRSVYEKTSGHCHFCGDRLVFEKYGVKDINDLDGTWEADHVIQRGKGGSKDLENCLPTCVRCNRLRWYRDGDSLRELILLGLVAFDEVKRQSATNNQIEDLKRRGSKPISRAEERV